MDNKTLKSRPKEFFLHLLAIVTLYISAISFITLLFQFWNYLLPDVAQEGYYNDSWLWAMRVAVASLIIVFPVFVGVSKYLNNLYTAEPDLRDLRVRKWLINFTLFIAAMVIIIDSITVIYNFISGEIALRFLLKAATILLTALLVFGYYFLDLKQNLPKRGWISEQMKKWIAYKAIFDVSLAVILSFFVMGSPLEARDRNIDNRRVSDLQMIQYQVINYWQAKGVLPSTLSELSDPTRGVIVPKDPETGEDYVYEVKGNLSFELCADFDTASTTAPSAAYPIGYRGVPDTWNHGAGLVCFERTIDPDFYGEPKRPF